MMSTRVQRWTMLFGMLRLCGAAAAAAPAAAASAASVPQAPRRLSVERQPWTGDFDAMLARRIIGFDVPISR